MSLPRTAALALISLMLPGTALAKDLVVPPLVAKGVDPLVNLNLTSLVSSEADFMGEFETVTQLDEAPTGLTSSCLSSTSCLYKIAQGASSDNVLAGSATPGGGNYTFKLVYYDKVKNRIVRTKSFELPDSPAAIADGMGPFVREVITGNAPAEPESAALAGFADVDLFEDEDFETVSASDGNSRRIATPTGGGRELEDLDFLDSDDEDADRREAEEEARAEREREEAAALRAEQEARSRAEEAEARARAEEEARRREEAEAQRRADEEAAAEAAAMAARRRAEDEAAAAASVEEEDDDFDFENFTLSSSTAVVDDSGPVEDDDDDIGILPTESSSRSSSSRSSSSRSSYDDLDDEPERTSRSSSRSSSSRSSYDDLDDEPERSSRSSRSSSSDRSSSNSAKVDRNKDSPEEKVMLAGRLGFAPYQGLGFVTYGVEVGYLVAGGLAVAGGIEAYSVQRTIPVENLEVGESAKQWNTILPFNIGLQYHVGTSTVRPYLGAEMLVVPGIVRGSSSPALGGRARAGANFFVAETVALNLNGAIGFLGGKDMPTIADGMEEGAVSPQVSGGTVLFF